MNKGTDISCNLYGQLKDTLVHFLVVPAYQSFFTSYISVWIKLNKNSVIIWIYNIRSLSGSVNTEDAIHTKVKNKKTLVSLLNTYIGYVN